jgi:murein DD-endopeptidase MepM/ murein hydrolase activator NlpD
MDGITASEEQEQSNMYDLLREVSSLTGQRQVDALFEMINNRTSTEITDKLTSYIAGMNRDTEQLLYRFVVSETLRVQQEIAMRVPTVINVVYETGEFVWPVAGEHRVTSPFGARRHPIFGVMRTHLGVDIAGAQIDGDEVFAIGSGTVIISDFSTYYGNFIAIFHGEVDGQRITSLYAQLSTVYVSEGETVERGQSIGRVGSTGLSTGAHLHFEVLADEEHVNPSHFVRPRMN